MLSLSDVASYAASFKSGEPHADVREPISDDDSSLSSFADADSDDGEMSSRRREGATLSPSRAEAKSSFSFKSRRVPKAPPFPAPPRETARALLWAEKKSVDHEVCVVENLSETADTLDLASPRDALERFFGPAFFQTQRLDAATRPAWLAGDSDSRYANETENGRADLADVYSAAAKEAVARARARYEATKKAVRRENREETARSCRGSLKVS